MAYQKIKKRRVGGCASDSCRNSLRVSKASLFRVFNTLSANLKKQPSTPNNSLAVADKLSVFDHFVGLVLKGLRHQDLLPQEILTQRRQFKSCYITKKYMINSYEIKYWNLETRLSPRRTSKSYIYFIIHDSSCELSPQFMEIIHVFIF